MGLGLNQCGQCHGSGKRSCLHCYGNGSRESSTLEGPTAGYGLTCGSQILGASSRENDNEDRERSTNCSLELKMELGNAT
jgi:hypothetical protein